MLATPWWWAHKNWPVWHLVSTMVFTKRGNHWALFSKNTLWGRLGIWKTSRNDKSLWCLGGGSYVLNSGVTFWLAQYSTIPRVQMQTLVPFMYVPRVAKYVLNDHCTTQGHTLMGISYVCPSCVLKWFSAQSCKQLPESHSRFINRLYDSYSKIYFNLYCFVANIPLW